MDRGEGGGSGELWRPGGILPTERGGGHYAPPANISHIRGFNQRYRGIYGGTEIVKEGRNTEEEARKEFLENCYV